ncbi:MAG: damage-control phosphatase ARMT1 family protein [Methanohalobium sp.]|uniref:damage-control phosphatase ARMT1 family protein n=1 Tax=Methanohalobium sp. TaxID=2837493 RepID=UPI00397ADAB5
MKINPRCAHCLLTRVHYEAELSTDDEQLLHEAVRAGIDVLNKTYRPGRPAGEISTAVHRKVYEVLGDNDPYLNLKKLSNDIAEDILPVAKKRVYEGGPRNKELFRRAVLASVIGNTFDFGVVGFDVAPDVFDQTFNQTFEQGLDVDDTSSMFEMLDDVVYIADNCGEILLDTIVFDIIRELGGTVTLVVRGAPILNDVTLEDVYNYGIDKKVDHLLTTGSNAIGVNFDDVSDKLLKAFDNASLIISKGMANYETLSEHNLGPIAYLLKTKCESVASDLGLETGYTIAKLVNKQ